MKLLKEYSTLDEALNYLTHETGTPVDLDYLIELEKEDRLKMLVYYQGEVNIVTNEITSSSTKFNDKTVSKYLEAIFKPTQKSVIDKDFKLLLGDEDSIYNYQYFVVHRLFNDPNFIPTFSISSDIYIDIDKPIIVKFDRKQVTKDDIRISSSELTKIVENFSYYELQKEIERLKTENDDLKAMKLMASMPNNKPQKEDLTKAINEEVSSRSQDKKLIAMLAILLAQKSNVFQVGNRPNATQINEAIINLAQQELQVVDDDMFGLKGNTAKISSAIKEYSYIIKNQPKNEL